MPMSLHRFALLLALTLGTSSALAQRASDGEWTMPSKDYSASRFSSLAQILSLIHISEPTRH